MYRGGAARDSGGGGQDVVAVSEAGAAAVAYAEAR